MKVFLFVLVHSLSEMSGFSQVHEGRDEHVKRSSGS